MEQWLVKYRWQKAGTFALSRQVSVIVDAVDSVACRELVIAKLKAMNYVGLIDSVEPLSVHGEAVLEATKAPRE